MIFLITLSFLWLTYFKNMAYNAYNMQTVLIDDLCFWKGFWSTVGY